MMTGQLPHEHGIHAHRYDFSHLQREDTFLSNLESYETIGVSANTFASPEFGFDGPFDRFSYVSPTRPYPDGLDPVEFTSTRDETGVSRYVSFLRAAFEHEHSLESIANGILGYASTVSTTASVPKLLDDGSRGIVRKCRSEIARTDEPFFLFTNFMEAHTPLQHSIRYDRNLHSVENNFSTTDLSVWDLIGSIGQHEEYLEKRRELYGAAIDYLDRTIAEFIEWVRRNTDRETTVIITADHGENLGYRADEYLVRHKSSLSEGLLHVPFYIVNPPEGYPATEMEYVSHLELGKLIAGLAEDTTPDITTDQIPAELVGMSAGPEPPSDRAYWDRMMRAVYENDRKFVWDSTGNEFCYELNHERPNWQHEVEGSSEIPSSARRSFAEELEEYKRRAATSERQDSTHSASVQRRLENLGYA